MPSQPTGHGTVIWWGIWPWSGYYEELAERVTLRGRVTQSDQEDDGDVTFDVDPDLESRGRLMTRPDGRPSGRQNIECEVELPDDQTAFFRDRFMELVGEEVEVVGTWIDDCFHPVKLEIHPIASIVCFRNRVTRLDERGRFDFFVLTDHAGDFWRHVPHSGENRVGEFRAPLPNPPLGQTFYVPRLVAEEFRGGRGALRLREEYEGAGRVLVGEIESGDGGNPGFFYGRFSYWLDSGVVEIRDLIASPKRFERRQSRWTVAYDLTARAVLAQTPEPGTLDQVGWSLKRNDEAVTVLRSSSNPLVLTSSSAPELSRGPDGRYDYRPVLIAWGTTSIPGATGFLVRRVIEIAQPRVTLSVGTPRGILGRRVSLPGLPFETRAVSWSFDAVATASDFVSGAQLSYRWELTPDVPLGYATARSVTRTGASPHQSFAVRWKVPFNTAYDYRLRVVATDQHGLEQEVASDLVHIPRPRALITAHVARIQGPNPQGISVYECTASVAATAMFSAPDSPLRYRWQVRPAARPVSDQSDPTLRRFSFRFEDDGQIQDPRVPFAARGPFVEVEVWDAASQYAKDILDAGLGVDLDYAAVDAFWARVWDVASHVPKERLLAALAELRPAGFSRHPPIPPPVPPDPAPSPLPNFIPASRPDGVDALAKRLGNLVDDLLPTAKQRVNKRGFKHYLLGWLAQGWWEPP